MLAEVQAANAAFNTIKSALKNGRELYDVSDSCATYFNSKSVIARRANKKRKGSYLENFMQLERLKKQEEWIREWMSIEVLAEKWLKWMGAGITSVGSILVTVMEVLNTA